VYEFEPIIDDLSNQREWTELLEDIANRFTWRSREERWRNNSRGHWTPKLFLSLDVAMMGVSV
jgi:hypothetical protein